MIEAAQVDGVVEVKAPVKAVKKAPVKKVVKKVVKKAAPAKKAAKAAPAVDRSARVDDIAVLRATVVVGSKGREAIAKKAGFTEQQVMNAMGRLRGGDQPMVIRNKHEDGSLEFVVTPAGHKALKQADK
jgi:hypothetical protein